MSQTQPFSIVTPAGFSLPAYEGTFKVEGDTILLVNAKKASDILMDNRNRIGIGSKGEAVVHAPDFSTSRTIIISRAPFGRYTFKWKDEDEAAS